MHVITSSLSLRTLIRPLMLIAVAAFFAWNTGNAALGIVEDSTPDLVVADMGSQNVDYPCGIDNALDCTDYDAVVNSYDTSPALRIGEMLVNVGLTISGSPTQTWSTITTYKLLSYQMNGVELYYYDKDGICHAGTQACPAPLVFADW